MKCLTALLTVVLGLIAVSRGAMTPVSVEASATFNLAIDSDMNQTAAINSLGSSLVVDAGATVRLIGATDGGGSDFTMRVALYCANGDFTIDGTDLVNYADTLVLGGCLYCPKGAVTVKGFKKVRFEGQNSGNGTTATLAVQTKDIRFDPVDDANGVVFSNAVTLVSNFETCPWTVAPGATFWPAFGYALYDGESATDTFTPDGWTLGIVHVDSVSNGTICVPAGGTMPFRPCRVSFTTTRMGNWSPADVHVLSRNVVLEEGACFECWDNRAGTSGITGEVSGAGEFLFTGQSANEIAFLIDGRASYTGATVLKGSPATAGRDTIIFTDPAPASSNLMFKAILDGSYRFRPTGYGETATAVSVKAFTGVSDTQNTVWLEANQTITVGTVSGRLQFRGPASSTIVISNLADRATIRLVEGVKLQVIAAAPTAQVLLGGVEDVEAGTWQISGPIDAAATPLELDVREVVPGGQICSAGQMRLWRNWEEKVALWTDASVADSFTYVRDMNAGATNVPENGILWWYDRRTDRRTAQDYALAMSRFRIDETANLNKYPTLFPLVTTGMNNGLSCVDFSKSQQMRLGVLHPGTALSNTLKGDFAGVATKSAVVVACPASSNAGSAILSTTDGRLAASRKGYNGYMFTNENVTVYRDGQPIANPTQTPWGNSQLAWHIFSFTTDDAVVNGLTTADDPHASDQGGGWKYAEVLLFSEDLTEGERQVVENRLAEKWGFTLPHADPVVTRSATVALPSAPTETPVLTIKDDSPYHLTVNLLLPENPHPGRYALVKGNGLASVQVGNVTGSKIPQFVSGLDASNHVFWVQVVETGTVILVR